MTGVELAVAAALDVAAGDPRWLPHPVKGMGAVIAWVDDRIRRLCRVSRPSRLRGCLALGTDRGVCRGHLGDCAGDGDRASAPGRWSALDWRIRRWRGRDLVRPRPGGAP